LIKTRDTLIIWSAALGGRGDTFLILRSLLSQIRLAGNDAERPESLSELTKIFEESVLAAASKQKPLVVVIDALDELPPANDEAPYLVSDALPDGVFFFVTCRPGDRLARFEERLFAIHTISRSRSPEPKRYAVGPPVAARHTSRSRTIAVSQGNPSTCTRSPIDSAGNRHNLELPATIEGFFRVPAVSCAAKRGASRRPRLLSVARSSRRFANSAPSSVTAREIDGGTVPSANSCSHRKSYTFII
jgi:hypothetical protein